jgi:hypothetical protein
MAIFEVFYELDKNIYRLSKIYSKISDKYRGASDFDIGNSQFSKTIEGQNMEKELSMTTDITNLNIDEIIKRINEITVIGKEKTNNIIVEIALNLRLIMLKNNYFQGRNDMNIDETFISKMKLLNTKLTENKNIINIITLNDAMDIIIEMDKNNPII